MAEVSLVQFLGWFVEPLLRNPFPPNRAGSLNLFLPTVPDLYLTAYISAHVGSTEKLYKVEIIV